MLSLSFNKTGTSRIRCLQNGIKTLGFFVFFLQAINVSGFEVGDPSTLLSATSQGRGGATIASSQYQDALFQNPASAVFSNRYALNASYLGWGDSLAASIVDTQSGPVGGGVYYVRRDLSTLGTESSALGNYTRNEEHMGFALMGKLSDQVGIGTNVRYVYRKSEIASIGNAAAWNFDVGLKFLPQRQFAIGIVGHNLMSDKIGIFPKRISGGIDYLAMANFSISGQIFKVDGTNLPSQFTLPNPTAGIGYAIGGEYVLPYSIALRSGYSVNPAWNQKLASFGAGYVVPKFSIDYAMQLGVSGSTENVHTVSVTGFF
jgi:hypothetical protein